MPGLSAAPFGISLSGFGSRVAVCLGHMSQIDLSTFFLSISSAACMSLGIEIPGAHAEARIDLDLARQNIDLLELMQKKTQGNRTAEEDRLLEHLLRETRLRFVEVQKQVRTGDKGKS